MKISRYTILTFLLVISLFHFSPHTTYANDGSVENEATSEAEVEEDNGKESIEEKEEENQSTDEVEKDQTLSKKSNVNLNAVKEVPTLKKGVHDERVIKLKENLSKLGFATFDSPNDYFSEATEDAVEVFQEYYGLSVTGVANETTLQKIEEILSSPFQNGERHEGTIKLKENLAILGYLAFDNPTTYYGSVTEAGVKAFQEANWLPVSGIYEQVTRQTVEAQAMGPLKKGMYREDAIELKEQLVRLGFASFSNPNTYFGSQTERAVEDFQEYYSLPITGLADETTLGKLEEVLASPFQKGKRHEDTIKMKEYLAILGYLDFGNPTTYYGSITEAGVKAFQKENGLAESGIYEEVTQQYVEARATAPLEKGMYREDAIKLKEDLVRLQFASFSNPNTYFGSQTEQAVKDFQTYYSLPVTGVADNPTLEKIEKVLSSPFQKGKRHQETIKMKENLAILGYLSFDNPTTYFGSVTEAGVKAFQEANGLPVTGIYEEVTRQQVEAQATAPLKKGMYREDAIELKENLVHLGFAFFSNPNTYFGSQTEQAVENFQDYYSLPVTGVADKSTIGKIEELLASPFQKGKRHEGTIKMKEDLAILGYLSFDNPTTLFGSVTEAAVIAFQEANGLPISGIYEEVTRQEVEAQATGPLKKGMYREDAIELKEKLVRLGFASFSNPNIYFGSQTERAVEDFQAYYSLSVTGIVEESTIEKIEEILSSPFQNGERHEMTIGMKEDLERLGFVSFDNPTTFYGSSTEAGVKAFQEHFDLPVSGIAEPNTFAKIEEILSSPFQKGKSHQDTIKIKENLVKLGISSFVNPNEYYGPKTEEGIKEFQELYELPVSGIADVVTVEALELAANSSKKTTYDLTLEEAVEMQMAAKAKTDKKYAYVSASFIENGEVTANLLNVRSGPGTSNSIVGSLPKGTKVNIKSDLDGWYQIDFNHGDWVIASQKDVKYYLDPNNFLDHKEQRFQFLDLGRTTGITLETLNSYLNGKGILENMGTAFMDASRTHGVNEIYLLSHALLETGHGTSELATGIEVGKNGKEEPVLVTKYNRDSLTDIEMVYNMFGIGAYDNTAREDGAKTAYRNGWTTPYKAIVGGASFIGNNYVKAGQNTLYKMRWNPNAMDNLGYASHQYATDIGWASKQIYTMYNLYQDIGITNVLLDIPEYK
ncbi:peptidoglycan-binding protein [Oceanobacillus manasiensis]|uniref:peptidoglycan-binding protein n=1 Tax=Oceanobacillus manasiensis TaxID=586413 RepID=UPI000693A91F|nr:peptidoglycan-binding protein [Oceanobacillus manasiensis]